MAESKMRIAVAGSNDLALLIATYIAKYTSHRIIVLSRVVCQILVSSLGNTLKGILADFNSLKLN
jgi:hypothetical protein